MKSKHVAADKSTQQSGDLAGNSRSPAGRSITRFQSPTRARSGEHPCVRTNEWTSSWYRESAPGGQRTLIHQLAPCGRHSTSICICLPTLALWIALSDRTPAVMLRERQVKPISRRIELEVITCSFLTSGFGKLTQVYFILECTIKISFIPLTISISLKFQSS